MEPGKIRIFCKWDYCGQEFPTIQGCYNHIRALHIASGQTQCKWENCHSISTSRCNLTNHVKTHLPFVVGVCYACERGFKWKGDFKRHMTRHSKQDNMFNDAVQLLLNEYYHKESIIGSSDTAKRE